MADDINGTRNPTRPHQPIFLLGILPRCGTNYLLDLLRVHPDCRAPEPVWEDFFLYHADRLREYVDAVYDHWTPGWGVDDTLRDRLFEQLGGGMIAFLAERASARRVVTKTPRIDNLHFFFTLFPDAHLLILVRDGRSVVESGVKSFGWYREAAIHSWAAAARTILQFDATNRSSGANYRIVRYEDLWDDLERELRRLLSFLELDPEVYDFDAAAHLPVRGSSKVREHGGAAIHWKPVARTRAFDPMSRWRHWSRARHERFNWVAGRYLTDLGYEPLSFKSNRPLWAAWNRLHDAKWLAVRGAASLIDPSGRRFGLRPQPQGYERQPGEDRTTPNHGSER